MADEETEYATSSGYNMPSLHYESVQRNGRPASIIRDDDGHIAYPSLVPPRIESPGTSVHHESENSGEDTKDGHQTDGAGSEERRPKAVSEPPQPGNLATFGEPSSGVSTGAVPFNRRRTASTAVPTYAAAGAMGVRAGRQRSSTTATAIPHVSLIQELRRTSSLMWSIPDFHNLPETGDDDANDGHGNDIDEGIRLAQLPSTAADAAPQPKSDAVKSKSDKKTSLFGLKRSKPHIFSGSPMVSFKTFRSQAHSRRDGRLPISITDTSHTGYLAKAVGAAVNRISTAGHRHGNDTDADDDVDDDIDDDATADSSSDAEAYEGGTHRKEGQSAAAAEFGVLSRNLAHLPCPKLNIVIMVIGSRGDAQPFLKIGKVLKEQYGHRVRVATHPAFKDFIEKDAGLEFFSVGGDPAELMAFIVKNPGLIPSLASVKAGDIGRRRDAMAEMFEGFWRACVDATDDPNDVGNLKLVGDKEPFVADAIIANPPSFAHVHCAEALGIPLHLMFTFPYTPTQAFPHPLANITKSNVDPGYTNFISYPLIDMMVWQGLGDLMNNLRTNVLDLDPIDMVWAPGAVYRMHVPFTYLFSPGLIPKPSDWGPEIDIAGFVFLDLASAFTPPPELEAFLAASPEPPIYIGFGSIVVDDPDKFTDIIFEAVQQTGVRALVSRGWGGLGGKTGDRVPDNIFLLDNIPHDWLFPRVRACIIHGGAGTTAIALKCGLPTMAVPFFGDQHFWGAMLQKTKVGPAPIPYKKLTAENLAESIRYLLSDEAHAAAQLVAASIEREGDGAVNACLSFVRTLELEGHNSMRCPIFPDHVAVWLRKGSDIKLSALAADALVVQGYLSYRNLRLIRHTDWNDFEGPGEPVTAVFGSLARLFRDAVSVPVLSAAGRLFGPVQDKNTTDKKMSNHAAVAAGGGAAAAADQGTKEAQPGSFEDVFSTVGRSVGQSAAAVAMAPIDLYFALCQGFHNAPRLYGDDTVRRPPHVTGFKSGLVAAGNEFALGLYDGVTGLVRLPIRWTRNGGGVRGFAKGTGMGLMGFVLKDISAILSPFGYIMKGLAKQASRARQPAKYLRRARIAQGQRDMRALGDNKSRQQCLDRAVTGWEALHGLHRAVHKGVAGQQAVVKDPVVSAVADAATAATSTTSLARRATNDSAFKHHHHTAVGPRRSGELSTALENADMAAVALAALRRGETLESVVEGRHNCSRLARQRRKSCCPITASFPTGEESRERMLLENLAREKRKKQRQMHGKKEDVDTIEEDKGASNIFG